MRVTVGGIEEDYIVSYLAVGKKSGYIKAINASPFLKPGLLNPNLPETGQ